MKNNRIYFAGKFVFMRRTLAILWLLLSVIFLQAQPNNSGRLEGAAFSGTVRGKVMEESTKSAVEYATVTLYLAKDSTMIDGMITDAGGGFEFKKLEGGMYNVIVRFMGFRKVLVEGVAVNETKPVNDIGTILLKADVTDLNEVEITAEKPLVEYKVDRKVVNVDQQVSAQGGTAVDVLERIPSIKTDLEGNVELRGSSSFTVLIDGKPSILSGSDALNQIPASTIDKIEIITNPSAKYDPDGTAGIINIITKKNALKGLSGIVTLSGSNSPDLSGSLMLNYRTKKASITFSADASNRQMNGWRTSGRESWHGDTTDYLETSSANEMDRKGMTLKLGMDYSITDKNTITGEASYRLFNMSRSGNAHNSNWSSTGEPPENYITDDVDDSYHPTIQFTLRDVQKFEKEGTELSMQLTYNQGDDRGEQETHQYLADDTWEPTGISILDYMEKTGETEKEWRGDIDFERAFSEKSKLEAGFQMRLDGYDEDYNYYDGDSTGNWELNTLNSNKYKFHNNIFALYGTYSTEWKKLGLKAGLRAEYTDRNLVQLTGTGEYPYTKFDLYPSVYLTYYLPYNQQMQLSYSKRVNRPRGPMLNPYPMFSDAFNSFMGNPELEPEFSHAMELNYQKLFGYSSLTLETYYRLTENKMTRVQNLNEEGVMVMTMENLDHDQSLGVEANANIKLTSWLTMNPIGSIYDYRLTETSSGEDVKKHSTNWSASIEFAANLNTGTKIRLNGNYDSPSVTVDGTQEGTFYVGLSARQDFLDNNLSVTISVRDLLDTRRMKGTSEGDNYISYNEGWRKAPIISLSLSYKWNNFKKQRAGSDAFDGDYDVINMGSF
jgi:hypothetical protein